jgi:hypothetical protein
MFGRRPDATLAKDVSMVRRFLPFISPRRNESLVYFQQEVTVDATLRFVEELNADRPEGRQITVFHVVLAALGRIFHERPSLNRFTAGGRLWQRDGVWITFSAKMRFADGSPLLTIKRRMDPGASIERMVDGLLDSLESGRSGKKTTSDSEVGLLLKLPPFVTRLLVRLNDGLDSLGLLPRKMLDADPLNATVFVANLGSVGLDSGYHHLWEHGNCPFFAVIGRIKEGEDGSHVMSLKYSYDERIEDGFYAARALERLKELIENPEKF